MESQGFPVTLIRNVRVFDGTMVGESTSVLLDGERIAAVAADAAATGARVVDGGGGVLLPGLIDAHVHVREVEELERLTAAGVTTALDMACWPRELVDSLRHQSGLTDLRSAGIPATAPGSTHSKMPGRPDAALVSGPAHAERFVLDRIGEGSDYIKLIADVPGPDQATLDALVAAAHAHGRRTVTHAATLVPYRMALAAGSDVITHAPLDAALDEDTVADMKRRCAVAVPTLTMMSAVAERFFGDGAGTKSDGPGYRNARRTVGLLHAAGVPILAGTDANATAGAPAAVRHGDSLHRELELLVEAGLTPIEALASATHLPAEHFGLSDRGAIAAGLRADVVLVDGDPTADIADIRQIRRVWCAGIEWRHS